MLAYTYINKIDFSKEKKILINGASGSIGSACVQLASYFGGEITAVCNTKNIDVVKSLGANIVIDYTKEDFTQCGILHDVIVDAVGKSSFIRCKKILKPGGTYFSTEFGFMAQNVFWTIITPIYGFFTGSQHAKKVKFPIPEISKKELILFIELMEKRKYRAVIDRIYTLEEIVLATRYVETGQKTGNVVISIEP